MKNLHHPHTHTHTDADTHSHKPKHTDADTRLADLYIDVFLPQLKKSVICSNRLFEFTDVDGNLQATEQYIRTGISASML